MKHLSALLLFLLLTSRALAVFLHGNGPPPPGSMILSQSATTIQGKWSSTGSGNTAISCVPHAGGTTSQGVDNSYQTAISSASHTGIVAGLLPSTLYDCTGLTVVSGVTQTFTGSVTTSATPSTTSITGMTWGTPANPIPNQNNGDTYFNAVGSNGTTYIGTDDSGPTNWGSVPTPNTTTANMEVAKFTSTSPFTGAVVNYLSNYGTWASCTVDNKTPKEFGIFAYNGNLYYDYNLFLIGSCPNVPSVASAFGYDTGILSSVDLGVTLCNWQGGCSVNGQMPSPTNASIFPSYTAATATGVSVASTNITLTVLTGAVTPGDVISGTGIPTPTIIPSQTSGTTGSSGAYTTNQATTTSGAVTVTAQACGQATFVMYGADNGTILPAYRVDNADAFVYFLCVPHNNGYLADDAMLARIPLAGLLTIASGVTFDTSKIQFYQAGADGSLDAAWTTNPALQTSILHNPGKMTAAAMQYIPSMNRYLMFQEYRTSPATVPTIWQTFEAAHPWGPWTLIDTKSWNPCGWYYQSPWVPSAVSAQPNDPTHPLTMLLAGDYTNDTCYQLWTVTGEILH